MGHLASVAARDTQVWLMTLLKAETGAVSRRTLEWRTLKLLFSFLIASLQVSSDFLLLLGEFQ